MLEKKPSIRRRRLATNNIQERKHLRLREPVEAPGSCGKSAELGAVRGGVLSCVNEHVHGQNHILRCNTCWLIAEGGHRTRECSQQGSMQGPRAVGSCVAANSSAASWVDDLLRQFIGAAAGV